MAPAEGWMVESWAVCWERALAQEMLRVVGCRTVDERRHMMAWHSWTVASVWAVVELLARAGMPVLAVKFDAVEVSASSVVEEALALEVASLCLLWVVYARHQFWAVRLLHPT
jgi:hypothetical protein